MIHEALAKNSLFPYETRTSMQLDFENNRRTEIDLFTGYIVKSAKALGIPVPLHDEAYHRLTNVNSSST
jgi:2-dehydropantoate 2-reductase